MPRDYEMNIELKHPTENYKLIAISTDVGGVTEKNKMDRRTFTDTGPAILAGGAPRSRRVAAVIDKQ